SASMIRGCYKTAGNWAIMQGRMAHRLPFGSCNAMVHYKRMVAAALAVAVNACSAMQVPVLYPNTHLQTVGGATAQRDIGECLQLAENSGLSKSNNQVVKHGAEGAAVGAAAGSVTLVGGGSLAAGHCRRRAGRVPQRCQSDLL